MQVLATWGCRYILLAGLSNDRGAYPTEAGGLRYTHQIRNE